MKTVRWLLAVCLAIALSPLPSMAQEPATISGRVTRENGNGVASVNVRIPSLNVGAVTGEDGNYRLVVPAARVRAGQQVQVVASQVGLAQQSHTVTLTPGASLTQNFQLGADPLQLEGLVVTGLGQTTTRERLGVSIASVRGEEITRVQAPNVVNALAGKAPGVEVQSASGEPGAASYIRIRGVKTISGDGQPLFVVDGVPINNQENVTPSSVRTVGGTSANPVGLSGSSATNRAADINPNDIESVEILKGPAASAIYGARAANGVVLITTKRGAPGQTQVTLNSTYTTDKVVAEYPLQTAWSSGQNGVTQIGNAGALRSWGSAAAESYDHWDELFETGRILENNLAVSGGSDRTTYYLSLGWLDHNGVIVEDNDNYQRTTARLKGSHMLLENLTLTGNFAYTQSSGGFTQKGSNVSGLLLGGLRTPPNFNNCVPETCYINQFGIQRTYTAPNAATTGAVGNFDNPFWVINENLSTTDVGRAFGNVALDYTPVEWMKLTYTIGSDYSNDERLEALPTGNATYKPGYVSESNFTFQQIDQSAVATVTPSFPGEIGASFTFGWNRNARDFNRIFVEGQDIIAPGVYQLDNTVTRTPDNYQYKIRSESFFGQVQTDFFEQLYLTAAVRNDGFSTFGESDKRAYYPKLSAAWEFTEALGLSDNPILSFGKLRTAWGQAGNEPPVYGTIGGLTAAGITDGGWGTSLNTTYNSRGGLRLSATKAQPDLKPERTSEFELGADFALLGNRANLGLTYYNARTEDAILATQLSPSTGYTAQLQNAATIRNRGYEVSLDVRPLERANFGWELGLSWSTNDNRVLSLGDSLRQFINMTGGFANATPAAVVGQRIGVLRGPDFARCGRGLTIDNVNLDATAGYCQGAPEGALYIGADGFPRLDATERVIADPHPDWIGGIRNTFTLFGSLQVSGLVDIRSGGTMWNGTKAALYNYGTHKDTEQRATCQVVGTALSCTGNEKAFGNTIYPNEAVAGPGAGKAVPIGENWHRVGLGSSFSGINAPYMEDAGFVKLREISVNYRVPARFTRRFSMSGVDLRLAGRNLATWTDYTGIDPETNVAGNTNARGIDYFNNPQTRQLIFSVGLTR